MKAALDWTTTFLAEKADEHPRRSAEWLLSAATGLSRVELYAFHDRPLSDTERATLRESVRRRAGGEPLQYVTGEVAFRHLVLKVRPGVLIPRPETEVLVDTVLPTVRRAVTERWSGGRGRPVHRFGLRRALDRLGVSGHDGLRDRHLADSRRSDRRERRPSRLGRCRHHAAGRPLLGAAGRRAGDVGRHRLQPAVHAFGRRPDAAVPRSSASSRASRWTAEPTASTSTGGFSQVGAGGCGPGGFWRSNSTKEWCGKRPRKR